MEKFLIGIDVGGTNIKIMVMEQSGSILGKCSIPTKREEGYESALERMKEAIDSLFLQAGRMEPSVAAIAMGLPGTVDVNNKKTIYLSVLHWDGFNPCEKLGNYYSAPTVIENDANLNALGEYAFGGHRVENLVLLTLGTGVGCGIIVEGKIFGGSRSIAGELGHMTIMADGGETCLCGRKGHLEAYCSGSSLERDAVRLLETNRKTLLRDYIREQKGQYDNSLVFRGAKENDQACVELVERFIHYLSVGVTNVMTILNPELVLLGGGVSNAGDLLINPVEEKCRKMVLEARSFCPVKKAILGSEAGMYGACALAARLAEKREGGFE